MFICIYYTEVVATLLLSLLFLWALHLSKSEISIPSDSNVSLACPGVALAIGVIIDCCEEAGSILIWNLHMPKY